MLCFMNLHYMFTLKEQRIIIANVENNYHYHKNTKDNGTDMKETET